VYGFRDPEAISDFALEVARQVQSVIAMGCDPGRRSYVD
jgi:hypothetical protein